MSRDLFAAFGDPLSIQASSQPDDFGDDDWGDFEDASDKQAHQDVRPTSNDPQAPHVSSRAFPPNAEKQDGRPPPTSHSKTGKHPFAGHMDFLFEPGEDEYTFDADLDNLATNPEAAMVYSKRLIAEQEARASVSLQGDNLHTWQAEKAVVPVTPPQGADGKITGARMVTNSLSQPPLHQSQRAATLSPARNKLKKRSGYVPAKDPYVLFDAENVSESDEDADFGGFESETQAAAIKTKSLPSTPAEQPPVMPSIDLLGLTDGPKSLDETGGSSSASATAADAIVEPPRHASSNSQNRINLLEEDNPWADFETDRPSLEQSITSNAAADSLATGTNVTQDDAGWGDFDDFETSEPMTRATQFESSSSTHSNTLTSHGRTTSDTIHQPALPPTNIPPPVLLLSVFPSLFSSAQENLFGPLSKLDTTQRHQLLCHPATHQFLRTFLTQAVVLAHIIAGRKLRWKRDQILAQSMRIGPAAGGGKGGMKLTGIDKSEVAKEDREMLDAVRLWKAQVGKLRGAVTGASNSTKLPLLPEISEQMPVKVLKAIEGGFVAPHACALCGLKREERVAKVDVDVDDSFGEWWVNGIDMHFTCKTWWEENKRKLQSR